MSRTLSTSLVFLSVISGALHAESQTAPPTITVRLYNMADAGQEEIGRAQAEASEIFARTGVTLAWADCTVPYREPKCGQVKGPAVVNLRLMPSRLAPAGLPEGVFGFALMSTSGDFARTANVYYDRAGAIADGRKYRHAVILGAMMAHEIGHLLLGQRSHSKYGLMSLPWGPKLLTLANHGMLSFAKREAKRVRETARKRQAAPILRLVSVSSQGCRSASSSPSLLACSPPAAPPKWSRCPTSSSSGSRSR